MRWSGRFADEVAASRATLARALAMVEQEPIDESADVEPEADEAVTVEDEGA